MFHDHICLDKLILTLASWRRNVLEAPNPNYYLLLLLLSPQQDSLAHCSTVVSLALRIPVCLDNSEGAVASAYEKSCRHSLGTSLASALLKGVGDHMFECTCLLEKYKLDCVVTM